MGPTLLVSWVVTWWLVWRVWRRGQVSRWLLIIFGSGFGCVNAAFHIPGHRAALVLLVIYAGQLALMLSPAISHHVSLQMAAEDQHGDDSSMSQPSDSKDRESLALGLRPPVHRDRRATSLPLLLLGGATAVGVVPQVSSGVGGALAGLLMALAFVAIWMLFRLRAVRAGIHEDVGLSAASMLGFFLVLVIVGLVTLAFTGPFLIFGVVLLVNAAYQRSTFLAVWAIAIGGIGVFEGFFGITNRLPLSLWAAWEHPAIYLTLALVTVLAGIVVWLRENRATAPPG